MAWALRWHGCWSTAARDHLPLTTKFIGLLRTIRARINSGLHRKVRFRGAFERPIKKGAAEFVSIEEVTPHKY
jgi:hypothetical protein